MAFEPINIFSQMIDPRGVAQLLRTCDADVTVTGPDDDWSEITLKFPGGLIRRGKQLTFGHDAEYYDGEAWSRQVYGMRNYFAEFPDVDGKAEILEAISTFRFALSVPQHDLDIDSDDTRLATLYSVCKHLDGVIFTPSSLRDSSGRVLIGAGGQRDPAAVLPATTPTVYVNERDDSGENELDDDEDWEPQPPTPRRVAQRAVVLMAVANRGLLENEQGEHDKANEFCQHMVQFIKEHGLEDEPEPDEWEVLQRPVGTLAQQQFINAVWRIEGLAMLSWALALTGPPTYDELVTPADLFDAMGGFDTEETHRVLDSPALRSKQELEEMLHTQLAFHWRMRDFSLRPEPCDFAKFSQSNWFGGFDLSPFRIMDGDLAIGEVAISNAEPDAISLASSLAMERHLAMNWLHGYSEIYSETDTST